MIQVETLVRLDGAVERVLVALVHEGYYKTKTEAIRAGILELGREYSLIGSETQLLAKRIQLMDAEVKAGKKKLYSLEEVAKEAGVKI